MVADALDFTVSGKRYQIPLTCIQQRSNNERIILCCFAVFTGLPLQRHCLMSATEAMRWAAILIRHFPKHCMGFTEDEEN